MKVKSVLLTSIVVVAWGSAFPILKLVLAETNPITLGFLRFLLATPILVLYAHLSYGKEFWSVFTEEPLLLALMGLTGVVGYHVLQNFAAEETSPTVQSIIISSNPMMVAILSSILLKERVGKSRVVGIALGFTGVILIVISDSYSASTIPSSLVGELLSIGAAFCWALYSVLSKRLSANHSAVELTASSMVFGTFFFLPAVYFTGKPQLPTSPLVWLGTLELSLISSCLAYALWNHLISKRDASRVSISLFLIPVVSAAISVIFLAESLLPTTVVGMMMVTAGILVAER
ncbi:MAG: EamA family transporter [Candidatus Bathyarchaeia archaeon]